MARSIDETKVMTNRTDEVVNTVSANDQPEHFVNRSVPVLFTSRRGLQLRRFHSVLSTGQASYLVQFCDLERWVNNIVCLFYDGFTILLIVAVKSFSIVIGWPDARQFNVRVHDSGQEKQKRTICSSITSKSNKPG